MTQKELKEMRRLDLLWSSHATNSAQIRRAIRLHRRLEHEIREKKERFQTSTSGGRDT